jgi:hypothetical protein
MLHNSNRNHLMSRFSSLITTALLVAIVAGCGETKTLDDGQDNPSRVDAPTGTDKLPPAKEPDNSPAESGNSESTNNAAIESVLLKREMIDAAAELMQQQQPDTEPDAVRGKVDNGIAQIRKEVPDFLMVSAETEKKLQTGTPIEGTTKRIAEAEAFFDEYSIRQSGLVASLLQQHKAGKLSPVRTELLAQLIVAEKQRVEAALSN